MNSIYIFLVLATISTALQAQTFVPTTTTKKNVVLEEYTGINCIACPAGHLIAENLSTTYPNKVFPINIHTGSYALPRNNQPDFRLSTSPILAARMILSGYPTATINRVKDASDTGYAFLRDDWDAKVQAQLQEDAIVNIATRCTINITTRNIKLHTEAYYTQNSIGSIDKLNIFITENNITSYQNGSRFNPNQILDHNLYNHLHMLRATISTNSFGEDIQPITSGSFHNKHHVYTMPEKINNVPVDLFNLEIISFIADSIYNVLNANKSSIHYMSDKLYDAKIHSAKQYNNINYCLLNSTMELEFSNYGREAIHSINGFYMLNGNSIPFHQTFAQPIALGEKTSIEISNIPVIDSGAVPITFTINAINNQNISPISIESIVEKTNIIDPTLYPNAQIKVKVNFDHFANENSLIIKNETDGIELFNEFFDINIRNEQREFIVNIIPNKCYSISFIDSLGDGLMNYHNNGISFYIDNYELLAHTYNIGQKMIKYFSYEAPISILSQNIAQNISLFPNPTQDLVNIKMEMPKAQTIHVEVINTLGQLVQNTQTIEAFQGENNIQLQVQNLANGMYFVRLYSQEGQEVLPFTLNK